METVIVWHRGKPANSGRYLVLMEAGYFSALYYSAKHRKWNSFDDIEVNEHEFEDSDVIAWADIEKAEAEVVRFANENK